MLLFCPGVKCFPGNAALIYEIMKCIFGSANFRVLLSVESSLFLLSVSISAGYLHHAPISSITASPWLSFLLIHSTHVHLAPTLRQTLC